MAPLPTAASSFYLQQLLFLLAWWALVAAMTRKPPHRLANGPCFTVPRWLCGRPGPILLLSEYRAIIFAALPATFALGAAFAEPPLLVRVLVAAAAILYHLTESAFTSRHGEYPLLYCSVAMVLPEPFAGAAAWGIAIHFILASGVAKLRVGGLAWAAPSTMRTYLTLYRGSKSRPPLSKRANRFCCEHAWASAGISLATLLLECALVPATLLLPPRGTLLPRELASVALVGMHVGIGTLMSLEVGLVFVSTLPSYLVGFACDAPLYSAPWALACALGLGPSLAASLVRAPIPESWPWTAVALFMFNGAQAQRIADLFMVGTTRLVLYPHAPPAAPAAAAATDALVGLPVAYHGLAGEKTVAAATADAAAAASPDGATARVLHDGVLRVLAFTLLHDVPGLAANLSARPKKDDGDDDAVRAIVRATQAWLRQAPRLYERRSGKALDCVAFVRVGEDGARVVEVLHHEP